mgnify:FL=1
MKPPAPYHGNKAGAAPLIWAADLSRGRASPGATLLPPANFTGRTRQSAGIVIVS